MENSRNEKGQFIKGRVDTQEEKLKRSESLKESWKQRKDYIGDLILECPRLYNSWRAIRFTEKGKKAGNCEEWNEYKPFYNDIRPFYIEGYSLRRKDITKPWSKDNFMYVSPNDISDITSDIFLEYQGKKYTLKQASQEFGIPYHSIKNRYYKHKDYTVEEIIFGKRTKRGSKVIKDISEARLPRSKVSKMISSYKHTDKKLGLETVCNIDIDWMLDNIVSKPCIYCGDTNRIGCDRIDNTKGHTKDNVVPCCYECNCARNNNFSFEEMKIIGDAIRLVKQNRLNNG